ncbi:MAG: hypothetical protein VYE77_02035 [Planctomycetota bacterium]|nr:hypothetical protein [Planctomycetota bacterium]
MLSRLSVAFALVVSLACLTGCSSGSGESSGGATITTCTGAEANVLCLEACNLGCGSGITCDVSEIAQNEIIVMRFSQDIDPLSVNSATIQFHNANGAQPVGQFIVDGPLVQFIPEVLVIGGQSFFGFRAAETYTMTMPGGPDEVNALRSTSGDPLQQTVTCTLTASLGIVDHNGVPPSARLVEPSQNLNVAQDAIIQLEFNELIDTTPFQGATGGEGPVIFAVRQTRVVSSAVVDPQTGEILEPEVRECNPLSQPVPLSGSPRVDLLPSIGKSLVTFRPVTLLPGNSCVEVTVTSLLRDLAGVPAQVQVFQFQTVPISLVEQEAIEDFDDDLMLDRDKSAGDWAGGRATFGPIGGDGRHGTYDPQRIGQDISGVGSPVRRYRIDTDNTIIPEELSITGSPVAVTDGQFFFDEMVVPADVELEFVGSSPPQFHVRGRLQIDGKINISGESRPYFEQASLANVTGDVGGVGGVFAGDGGQGGDRCFGVGAQPNMNGRDGGSCRVLANHAFAGQVGNTAGRGSTLFPATGQNFSVQAGYPVGFTVAYNMQVGAGGSGGGLWTPGGPGRVVTNPVPDPITGVPPRASFMGPNLQGGVSVPLLPVPAGAQSGRHFLVGGSGGGGGATSAAFNINLALNSWGPGSGGGGGGGAIALRAGNVLRVGSAAQVLAAGGSAGVSPLTPVTLAKGAPGGGGSGGSVVMQSGNLVDVQGLVDVRGGGRGKLARNSPPTPDPRAGGFLHTEGGEGSRGVLRVEAPVAPQPTSLPNVQPPAGADDVAILLDEDVRSAFQSKFYSTDQPFGPQYVRYEIRAFVDGNPQVVVFSDDPSVGTPANSALSPIEVYFQGGTVDLVTGAVDLQNLTPWRTQVGSFGGNPSLADDGLNGFRFQIVIDRSFGSEVEIDSIKVIYRV